MSEVAVAAMPYAFAIIGGLLATLCSVLAWVGASMNKRLSELTDAVGATNTTLNKIERDLRGELSRLDRRVTLVEARCGIIHGRDRESDS